MNNKTNMPSKKELKRRKADNEVNLTAVKNDLYYHNELELNKAVESMLTKGYYIVKNDRRP